MAQLVTQPRLAEVSLPLRGFCCALVSSALGVILKRSTEWNKVNCAVSHAVPGDNQFEKIGEIGLEDALAVWHRFPSAEDMAYFNENEFAQTPTLSFNYDQHRAFSISVSENSCFQVAVWERYGTTSLYAVPREKAEKLLMEFFIKKWTDITKIFKSDASAVIIQGERNPIKRWWTKFRLSL